MTKTQIDRLGERLKKGEPTENDLRLLDAYRLSFGEAYRYVFKVIRDQLGLEPSGRHAKSTGSICEKLRRESVRLSQMQDIAGCRVTVANINEQAQSVERLKQALDVAALDDRLNNPSHGYRAMHAIIRYCDKLVEVQVRTANQHVWAQLSEGLADNIDVAIKYGGGPEAIRSKLEDSSREIARLEILESRSSSPTSSQDNELKAQQRVVQASLQELHNELLRIGSGSDALSY